VAAPLRLGPPPGLRAPWSPRAPTASDHAMPTPPPARSVPCGLDMRRRMRYGGASRGEVWGRPQTRRVGACWGEGWHTGWHTCRGGVQATDTHLLRTHRLRDHARRRGYQATQQHTTVEPGFRWIKNPAAISPVWLEKSERIVALAMLTVNPMPSLKPCSSQPSE
jgi:hypothetical protein